MVIPDLDLVMAFYAGNYNDVGGRKSQRVYVPNYILPAIEEGRKADYPGYRLRRQHISGICVICG
jgi:hypothetical protein